MPHPSIRGNYVIVHGERRWAAAIRARGPLLVYRLHDWFDFMAWMLLDVKNQYEPGALAMKPSEMHGMVEQVRALLQPGQRVSADATIGDYLGTGRKPIQDLRMLYGLRGQLGEEMDRLLDQEIKHVDAGLLVPHSAWERMRRAIARHDAPEVSAGQQRKILNNSGRIGSGLIDGLQGLGPGLDDTLTPGECAEWARQLGATRLKLEQVIRLLKERANG